MSYYIITPKLRRIGALALATCLLAACTSTPVRIASAPPSASGGVSREVSSKACGFQLLLFIPIAVNSRQTRAYADLLAQARGDSISDVQMQESWFYGFAGTGYCTEFKAQATARGG